MGKHREEPYIVILVSDTDRKHTLRPREWDILEKMFSKYPEIARIECLDRMYTDIVKEDGQK